MRKVVFVIRKNGFSLHLEGEISNEELKRLLRFVEVIIENRKEMRRIEPETDPLLSISGLGKEIWEGIDPDEYVKELREGYK